MLARVDASLHKVQIEGKTGERFVVSRVEVALRRLLHVLCTCVSNGPTWLVCPTRAVPAKMAAR